MALAVRNGSFDQNIPPQPRKLSSRGKSLQECTRRRRCRAFGSCSSTASVAEHTRKRRLQSIAASQAESSSGSHTLSFPQVLARPKPCANTIPANLRAIGEDWLEGSTVDYVRDQLVHLGPDMFEAARLARPVNPIVAGPMPSSVSLMVPTPFTCLPTHAFALDTSTSSSKLELKLYPVHNAVFSAYCSALPPLPTSSTVQSISATEALVNVPIFPLRLPSPVHFPLIHHFLYTKQETALLRRLLPIPPSPTIVDQLVNGQLSPDAKSILRSYIQTLKANVHPSRILKALMDVHGVWKNTCALGIVDERLWSTLDLAWTVLLYALPRAQ